MFRILSFVIYVINEYLIKNLTFAPIIYFGMIIITFLRKIEKSFFFPDFNIFIKDLINLILNVI